MLKHLLTAILASAVVAPAASASVYTDELAKCLVEKTTKEDHALLVKWIFAAVSVGPEVKPLSRVTPEQRADYTHAAGNLMMRLLTVDCREQTVKAVKYDGPNSIEVAFELLGKVAMQALMADPAVEAEFAGLTEGLDVSALASVFVEAGLKPAGRPPIK
ncbi:MAG: hypothetical protein KF730_14115 [Sphingomonas sp.]|uniref:hypothetical protein n=1 Tax=Sphingomonas sp. TaxID=28214 RepID=UPI0025D74E08|nr:hypothetical protein [Sphingomonas sp.]MBX3565700.1 hypothetical protein [Sphingomonas sp.]